VVHRGSDLPDQFPSQPFLQDLTGFDAYHAQEGFFHDQHAFREDGHLVREPAELVPQVELFACENGGFDEGLKRGRIRGLIEEGLKKSLRG